MPAKGYHPNSQILSGTHVNVAQKRTLAKWWIVPSEYGFHNKHGSPQRLTKKVERRPFSSFKSHNGLFFLPVSVSIVVLMSQAPDQ